MRMLPVPVYVIFSSCLLWGGLLSNNKTKIWGCILSYPSDHVHKVLEHKNMDDCPGFACVSHCTGCHMKVSDSYFCMYLRKCMPNSAKHHLISASVPWNATRFLGLAQGQSRCEVNCIILASIFYFCLLNSSCGVEERTDPLTVLLLG